MKQINYILKGQIVSHLGTGIPGLQVEIWDADLIGQDDSLIKNPDGSPRPVTTDANGYFEINFSSEDFTERFLIFNFDKNPDIYFKIYKDGKLIKNTIREKIKNFVFSEEPIKIVVDLTLPVTPDEELKYSVSGYIKSADGLPASNLTVKAYDKDLRSEEYLNEAVTNSEGHYHINYKPRDFQKNEEGTADLLIRVYDSSATLLFEPDIEEVMFNATSDTSYDIQLKEYRQYTSEFEMIAQTIQPLLNGLALAELKEDKEHHDISFLSKDTQLPFSQIEYFAIAHKLQKELNIPPEFFYAIFRQGTLQKLNLNNPLAIRLMITINSNLQELVYDMALLDRKTIEDSIQKAVEHRIIIQIQDLNAIIDQLHQYNEAAQDYIQNERPEQLVALLQQSLDAGKHLELMTLAGEQFHGDVSKLMDRISKLDLFPDDAVGKKAKTDFHLSAFLGPDKELIGHVKHIQKINEENDVNKLARLNREEWKEMLSNHPDEASRLRIKSDESVLNMEADNLVNRFAQKYPTTAFIANLERDKEHLFRNKDAIVEHLDKLPQLDLAAAPVDTLLKGAPVDEEVKKELRSMQRLYRLTPDYNKAKKLHQDNLHSAHHIAMMGKTQFVKRYTEDGTFTEQEAKEIFNKASDRHTASLFLAAELKDYALSGDIQFLNGDVLVKKIESVSKEFPNLKTLFREIDLCECEHCRSVYSPAAYLVDVLQFLKNRRVGDTNAKEILFKRRPDLGDLDLNCENSNTAIPYIDLVCEVLEEAVSPSEGLLLNNTFDSFIIKGIIKETLFKELKTKGFDITKNAVIDPKYSNAGVDTYILRDKAATIKISREDKGWRVKLLKQTHRSAEELSAIPEYVNEGAYTVLQEAKLSFRLPFNKFHQEGRLMANVFNTSRSELMQIFQAPGFLTESDIATEFLNISAAERDIIFTSAPDQQNIYWNTEASVLISTLEIVDIFLQRSGLEYKELQELLHLDFINPEKKLFIQHLDNTCNTAKKKIANLDKDALDRMHRFIRLCWRTGWEMSELNSIIGYRKLGNNNLNEDSLKIVVKLLNVKEVLGISLEQFIAFYGLMPDDTDKSIYAKTYLNSVVTNPVDKAFLLESIIANEGLEAAKQDVLVNHLDVLALAVKRKKEEVNFLIEKLKTNSSHNPEVTRENLAFIYRNHILAKSLRITFSDLYAWSELTGKKLFASPVETLELVEKIKFAQATSFKLEDLLWMLKNEDSSGKQSIADADITSFLKQLQIAYREAYDATRSKFNEELNLDENKNYLKAELQSMASLNTEDADRVMSFVSGISDDSRADAFKDKEFGDLFNTTEIKLKIAEFNKAAPDDKESAGKNLVQSLMAIISEYLFINAKKAILLSSVQQTFAIDDVVSAILLNNAKLKMPGDTDNSLISILTADALIGRGTAAGLPGITTSVFDKQYRAVRLLHKIIWCSNKLPVRAKELEWLLNNSNKMGWLELDRLPYQSDIPKPTYETWEKLHTAIQLMQLYKPVPDPDHQDRLLTWIDVWKKLVSNAPKTDTISILSLFTAWDKASIFDLDNHYSLKYPDSYKEPATYLRFEKATAALRLLGVELNDAKKFTSSILSPDNVKTIRQALRAKYDEDQWLGVMKPIQDALRPQKRDALIAYLLATNPNLKESRGLYDHFLIDVEMGACQPSSRIVMAHGIVQLFVQRCMMGLERDVPVDTDRDNGWLQWKWMQNFRVWEANRKVFLYPENWIEPELRDNKSFFFTDMEQELLQNEVTDRAVEDAAIRYLEKLDDVANLDVRACFYDVKNFTQHVFARVRGGSTYYYRKFIRERSWTPWEKVDVDISGDHLLAFTRNNRLYLAWPLLTEEVDREQKVTIPSPLQVVTPQRPRKRYNIQLAISEYVNKKWQPKRVSQNFLFTDYDDEIKLAEKKDTLRLVNMDTGNFAGYLIYCSFNDKTIGFFNLTGCKGYPEAYPFSGKGISHLHILPGFDETDFLQMQYREQSKRKPGETLSAGTILSLFRNAIILNKTPGIFRITYPHQLGLIDWLIIIGKMLLQNYAAKSFQDGGSYGSEVGTRFPKKFMLPLGSFMPFFYGDNDREFVIVPGFFAEGGANDRTFTDIHQFVSDVIALIKKYSKELAEMDPPDLGNLKEKIEVDEKYIALKNELGSYTNRKLRPKPKLMFRNFYHPLVCFIKSAVYNNGLGSIMDYKVQAKTTDFDFDKVYKAESLVATPYPIEDIDFNSDGSYSSYNWELFFHLPFFMATQLSQNQRFEESQKWFHYIFNPINISSDSAPQKFWVTKPFHEFVDYESQRIDTILSNLAGDPGGHKDLVHAVSDWRENPFMPHQIARTRPLAYQKAIIMKYLDNLIAWADNLFRQDTMESITQAAQLYILAARLLGPKPRTIPPAVKIPYETYEQLEAKLDSFSNVLLDLENLVPDLNLLPHKGLELPPSPVSVSSLYFSIPHNDKLLSYWDVIADRLFKIRNCQNIEGIERILALFAPPIDPGALVRAAASGIDISTALNDINAPLPLYRFNFISQKATELAQEVRNLGSALLAALEKKDTEELSLLRSKHEVAIQQAILDVRDKQIEEAALNIEALKKSKDLAHNREEFYGSRGFMNEWEELQTVVARGAIVSEIVATVLDATSGGSHMIPNMIVGATGVGGSPTVTVKFGGENVGSSTAQFATLFRGIAGILHSSSNLIGTMGSYKRRMDDWEFQRDLAKMEQDQIQKQIDAADIRLQIAEKEKNNQNTQLQNAQKVDEFMRTKFTNKDLYAWMSGQLSAVYFQAYQLAYDLSKKAEQAYRYELAAEPSFIKFGNWDTTKKGLLSGEKLLLDIKRMEISYMNKNKREYELTKHVSLSNIAPEALLQLRNTGKCDFNIPEFIFDMDYPGQYMRRIKSVSFTIPCIAGPYTTIGCRLSLVSNKYRKNTLPNTKRTNQMDKYIEDPGNDTRFAYNLGTIQSIATSSAQNDSGIFEVNFRDERYLPFEGMGAIGSWHLEMNDPSFIEQFNYQNISDVIIHLRYTAREGGSKFKKDTEEYLKSYFSKIAEEVPANGLFKVFDLKHEFPDNWYKFMNDGSGAFKGNIKKEYFPYFAYTNKTMLSIKNSALFVILKDDTDNSKVRVKLNKDDAFNTMEDDEKKFGNAVRYLDQLTDLNISLQSTSDDYGYTITFDNFTHLKEKIESIWIIQNYSLEFNK